MDTIIGDDALRFKVPCRDAYVPVERFDIVQRRIVGA